MQAGNWESTYQAWINFELKIFDNTDYFEEFKTRKSWLCYIYTEEEGGISMSNINPLINIQVPLINNQTIIIIAATYLP